MTDVPITDHAGVTNAMLPEDSEELRELYRGFEREHLIPLWTLIQARAPDGERGRYLGTANAISFAFMTVGAVVYAVWSKALGLGVSEVFLLNSGLALLGCLIFLVRRRRLAGWVQES